ncbi:MAG: tetratricopeptide repeat-containing glycosyltransferase [Bacillota bacterium]
MLLSVCIVVKDMVRTIEKTVNSVKELADEIIVVDRGSMDNTDLLLKSLDVKLYELNDKDSGDLYCKNFAREKASGKWIFFLEGNEELLDDYGQLRSLLKDTEHDGFYIPITEMNFLEKLSLFNVEMGDDFKIPRLSLRLYQNNNKYKYSGDSFQSITKSIISTRGETSLKVLHLPVVRRYDISFLPREIIPVSLFSLEADDDIFIMLKNKQYKRAAFLIDKAIKSYPGNIVLLFWRGYLKYLNCNYEESLKEFQNLSDKLKKEQENENEDICINTGLFLGLNFLALDKKNWAEIYFKNFFRKKSENRLVINVLLDLFLEKEFDSDDVWSFFDFYNNGEGTFSAVLECLYYRKRYKIIRQLLDKINLELNSNYKYYILGLVNSREENYKKALAFFKKIDPGFEYYQNVLYLRWILNLNMPGVESRSVVNRVKLLGNKVDWNIINFFNEIYFYKKNAYFKFDNLIAKLRFYNRCLFFLSRLIEFGCSDSIIVMLEIIDSLNLSRSDVDIGLIFYVHGFYQQAYDYLNNYQGVFSYSEKDILIDLCSKINKYEELDDWIKRTTFQDSHKEINVHCRIFAPFVE